MTTSLAPEQLMGHTAVDNNGDKIGSIGQVYLDDQTGQPTWVTVSTGLFGTKESFAPLTGARLDGDQLVLAVTKAQVKDAPNVDNDGHIDESEQSRIHEYYSQLLGTNYASAGYADTDRTTDRTTDYAGETGGPGRDTSGPNTDTAMTRSEEQIRVGTERVETGRARLRKYIVTENVTQTVPVSREEVRIEREPITDGNVGQALDGPDISEEEHEVTLHAERPVVAKETVPVERVRLDTETVTDQTTVDETVRKEQIEFDGDETTRRGKA